MAKYRLKDARFAIHLQTIKEEPGPGGKMIKRRDEKSLYYGEVFELSAADAIAHVHKIEPVDEAAKVHLAQYHAEQEIHRAALRAPMPAAAPQPMTADSIAVAIIQALNEAGMLRESATLKLPRT